MYSYCINIVSINLFSTTFQCSIFIEKTVLQLNLERVTIHDLQWTLSHSWLKIIPPNCKNIIVQHCWSIDLDRQLGISKQNSGPREKKRDKSCIYHPFSQLGPIKSVSVTAAVIKPLTINQSTKTVQNFCRIKWILHSKTIVIRTKNLEK